MFYLVLYFVMSLDHLYFGENGYSIATTEFTVSSFHQRSSRIDVLVPLDTEISVKIGDKVQGRLTKLGALKG